MMADAVAATVGRLPPPQATSVIVTIAANIPLFTFDVSLG
jgi:hypothetical protein